ncbi:MAG: ABC transporter permease [Kiloniellaceae bacterium]
MSSTLHSAQEADGLSARLARLRDSEFVYEFTRSPLALLSAAIFAIICLAALLAPLIAPMDPFDPANANIVDARLPPLSEGLFGNYYLLGSDPQGRDIFSTILFGARTSLLVGLASVLFAGVIGVVLGLLAGYAGGFIDTLIMRTADVQLSFPAILIALLIDGIARNVISREQHESLAILVLVFAIGISNWVQYARTVRSVALVERSREYVQAAAVTGVHPLRIIFRHILPNVLGPVLVIATINLALAIITESTLSFLGVGVPPTQPSLGTLVRIGNEFLFSGSWWISIFPGMTLVVLSLSVNLLGDWLRDALNPKLR